jgi:hypothetical protein
MLEHSLPPSTIEQSRLELTMAAGSAERANRPRILLYGAILLLVIATIYALSGVTSRQGALGRVAKARKNADDMIKLVNQVKGLQATLAGRGLDPNPRIAGELEQLATLSGLTMQGTISDQLGGATGQAGMAQRKYSARFINQDPAALLQFLNVTQEDPSTAGLEFARLDLLPGQPDPETGQVLWNLSVDFTRWERQAKR